MKKIITIPDKAVSWNTLYSGVHWSSRKKLADYWHSMIRFECFDKKVPHFQSVSITIISRAKRPIDADNICAKVIIDGLIMANVIDDDSPVYVKSVTLISEKAPVNETEIILQGS